MLPQDPMMLLSVLNLKLRDMYSDFDSLCDDMDVDKAEIINKLAEIGYKYDSQTNQFK